MARKRNRNARVCRDARGLRGARVRRGLLHAGGWLGLWTPITAPIRANTGYTVWIIDCCALARVSTASSRWRDSASRVSACPSLSPAASIALAAMPRLLTRLGDDAPLSMVRSRLQRPMCGAVVRVRVPHASHAMSVSRPCDQCSTVKRCTMFMDDTTRKPIYLCPACARDLGYARKDAV